MIMTPATRRYGALYLQSIWSSGGNGCSLPHASHINQYASPSSDTARLDPSQPLAMIVSPTISTSARDLVPRFFETRRTSMPALAHQHSVLDAGHRRPTFNRLSEKLRQFRSVLHVEQ